VATVVHGVEYIVDRAWVGMFESDLRGHPTKFHAEQAADLSLDNEHRIAAMCTRSPSGAVGGRHSAHVRRARRQRSRGAIIPTSRPLPSGRRLCRTGFVSAGMRSWGDSVITVVTTRQKTPRLLPQPPRGAPGSQVALGSDTHPRRQSRAFTPTRLSTNSAQLNLIIILSAVVGRCAAADDQVVRASTRTSARS